jgi:hypothetical protein
VSVQDLEMILGSIIFRVVEKKKSIILVLTSNFALIGAEYGESQLILCYVTIA